MFTIAPDRRARMPGRTALIIATVPKKCVSNRGADVGVVTLLDGGAVAVACVVDQHVDTAEPLLGLPHRGRHLLGVGDVERDREHSVGRGVGQVGDFRDIAGGDDGVVARADRRLRRVHGRAQSSSR